MELYRNQKEILNWLLDFAKRSEVENICIVEGFSGLGKTSIARQLQLKSISASCKALLLTLPDGALSIDDFYLELAAELSSMDIYGLEEAISNNKPLTIALRKILERENLWIIIDEFQNVSDDAGQLMEEVQRLIGSISTHSTKGKIVAFSNQIIQRGKWLDQVVFKKLGGPTNEEALSRLENLMHDKGIVEKIEDAKKRDIIRILGNNPRAINIFTDRWRWASNLDELLGEIPEIWEARDQEISPRLLKELEEQLIRKGLERFTQDEIRIIEGLSVLRKPFQKEAIERMPIKMEEATRMREKFQQYFFLENNLSWFSFHPILKEICKLKLSSNRERFKKANAKAAEYYTRHFTQSNLKKPGKLGGYFVEARYHLIMAQSEDKLQQVAANFEFFIRATIKTVSPIPVARQLLDERIGLLTAFLGSGGPKGLEFHLAKCLEKRGMEGDDKQALIHAKRAVGLETPVEAWLVKMRLETKVKGLLTAIDTGYIALSRTAAVPNAILYQSCAELMDKAGQVDEAIKLLKDGIAKIPAGNNSFALYQSCAELMDKAGQVDEAIKLLKDGIAKIPAANSVVSLYQSCAELMDKAGQVDEAIKLLKDGIAKIPVSNQGYKLSEQLTLICYRDSRESELDELAGNSAKHYQAIFAKLLKSYSIGSYEKIMEQYDSADFTSKTSVGFSSQVAFGLLISGQYLDAETIIEKSKIQPGYSLGGTWLLALNAYKNKREEEAKKYFKEIHLAYNVKNDLSTNDFVSFWYEYRKERNSPFYYFPHLPESLTGYTLKLSACSLSLEEDVLQCIGEGFRKEVTNPQSGLNILTISTEWFSRNGGLSTFNRLLCENLSQLGNKVCCLVPEATDDEKQAALIKGVALVEATISPGFNLLDRLSLKPSLPLGFKPDIIIAHDRITGPAMVVQKESFFQEAKSLLFIHTAPAEIEWYKPIPPDKTISQKSEERERLQIELSKKANFVVAVGKKLYDEVSTQLSGVPKPPRILQFNPGLLSNGAEQTSKVIAPKPFCLLLGRVEDFTLKGVDIAAKALELVSKSLEGDNKPVLVIRGAQVGTGDELKKRAQQVSSETLEIRPKEYSSNLEIIQEELNRASLVLMPSRTEGFGLVGLEAIEAKCPVLISDNSGLAKMLKTFAPNQADHWIVKVTGNFDIDSLEWSKRIQSILENRTESNMRMVELYNHLKDLVTWPKAVEELMSIFKTSVE